MELRNLYYVGRERLVILDMVHHRLRLEEWYQWSHLVKVPSCKVVSSLDKLFQGVPVLSNITELLFNSEVAVVWVTMNALLETGLAVELLWVVPRAGFVLANIADSLFFVFRIVAGAELSILGPLAVCKDCRQKVLVRLASRHILRFHLKLSRSLINY